MDMPIKKEDAEGKGRAPYQQIFLEIESLKITCLLEQVAHKEKTKTAYKTMIGDIGSIMVVFVGTVKYDADDCEKGHQRLPMLQPITAICYIMH